MLRIVLTPFMLLSGLGLLVTALIHLAALLKFPFAHYNRAFFLAIGVFVVWLPSVLIATKLTKEFKQKDLWRAALRGCPQWLRNLIYVMFGYAILNFVYMLVMGHPDDTPASSARFISGHLLPFYSVALGILYSAIKVHESDPALRCSNGHPVSPAANYCEECGVPILRHSANQLTRK